MRDLAKSVAFSQKRSKSKKRRLITLLVIAGVVSFAIGSVGNVASTKQDGPVVLSQAPSNLKPVSLDGIEKMSGESIELTTETARMKDVRYGGEATAKITRAYGGGIYKLDVQANLPDPVNVNYGLWLVGSSGPVLVDYLRGADTSWTLDISGPDNFSKYKGVWITLERGKDNKPEEKIMEGSF